jgi:protein-tyrosine sulfotransferase
LATVVTSVRTGIVVIGAPRSGTTVLRRLIDAHPNIACPGETNLFVGLGRLLEDEVISGGAHVGVEAGLAHLGVTPDEFSRRARDFAVGFLDRYAHAQGKARWAEKTAFNSFYISGLERILGDSVHYVCLVRHGLDVVCSLDELSRRNGRYLKEIHSYICRYARPLEAFAHLWNDINRDVLDLLERRGDQAHLIRYEDLIEDPDRELYRLFAFLGEKMPEGIVDRALGNREPTGLGDWKTYSKTALDSDSIGRWRSLPRELQAELARIVKPTLERFRYAPVPSEHAASAADDRRRYELGLMATGLVSDAARSS